MLSAASMQPGDDIGRVDVYYNLHKRLWSCRCRKSGRVIRHSRVICAPFESAFVVRESGRLLVLQERRKNVHAFARIDQGLTSDNVEEWGAFVASQEGLIEVSYNPYRGGSFYRKDTGADVGRCSSLLMLALSGEPPQVFATL